MEPTDPQRNSAVRDRRGHEHTASGRRRSTAPSILTAIVTGLAICTVAAGCTARTPTATSTPTPFAADPRPDLERAEDQPEAVAYPSGELGIPHNEFRSLGVTVGQAIQDNDLPSLLQMQPAEARLPNTSAGILSYYGGLPISIVE